MSPAPDAGVLDHALAYAARGWRVVPITPGCKYPPMKRWQDVATRDPELIEMWWTGQYRGHGVGIATGPGSGIWVLDVDVGGTRLGDIVLAQLELTHGDLPPTIEAVTGSGGRHLYFAWDPARPVRNNQSGLRGDDIDVRGEGGQVLAPPTIHPATGRAYQWRVGHEPW